jgi:hypothetical protein
MPDQWKQVEQWRNRVEEIRASASSFSVPSAKENMLTLAQGYERLADDLERHLMKQSVPKPECVRASCPERIRLT